MNFCDSCRHYGANADILKKWSGYVSSAGGAAPVYSSTKGRDNLGSIKIAGSGYTYARQCGPYLIVDNQSTALLQFRMQTDNNAFTEWPLIGFLDETGTHGELYVKADGTMEFVTGTSTVRATGTAVIPNNVLTYIEIKYYVHASTGVFNTRVNGTDDITFTGITKAATNAYINRIGFYYPYNYTASGSSIWISDIVIMTGSSTLDMLGECNVGAYFPTGAGSNTNWTPSTGSNYACVNKTSPGADSKYISSATNTQKDTYAYGDLPSDPATIPFVQQVILGNTTYGGLGLIKPVCLSVGDESDGDSITTDQAAAYKRRILTANPHGNVAWTKAGFNAAEFGVMYSSP